MIGFFLFAIVHNRKNAGSSRLRGDWLIKYWPEAEVFKYSQKYEAVIFQKVYFTEYAQIFKGKKILDICDPDWLEFHPVKEMAENVDVITCPTEGLAEFLKNITSKPIIVIPDRQDLKFYPRKKVHLKKAKSCVWFGYSHNITPLRDTVFALKRLNLKLTIISDRYISLADYGNEDFKKRETFVPWELKTVNNEILKHDIVLMPPSTGTKAKYKSNNKTTTAWALGMPAAETAEDLERFLDPKEREKEKEIRLKEVKEKYDIKQSIAQFKEILKNL